MLQRFIFSNCHPTFFRLHNRHLFTTSGITPDRRIDPPGRCGRLSIYQCKVNFYHLTQAKLVLKPTVSAVILAIKISPEVSLSNRCTTPGRCSPPIPSNSGACARAACTKVPHAWPAAGWTTIPAGLLITIKSSFSNMTWRGMSSGINLLGTGGGRMRSITSPTSTILLDLTICFPPTLTKPSRIQSLQAWIESNRAFEPPGIYPIVPVVRQYR